MYRKVYQASRVESGCIALPSMNEVLAGAIRLFLHEASDCFNIETLPDN